MLYNLSKERKICRTDEGKYKKANVTQRQEKSECNNKKDYDIKSISLEGYIKRIEEICVSIDEVINVPGVLNIIDDKQVYDIYRLNKLNQKIMLELSQYKKA